MKNTHRRHPIVLAIALALGVGTTTPALADGRLQGRVEIEGRSGVFEGVVVRIRELNRTISTGRDGRFILPSVPAGTYTVVAEYVGADPIVQEVTVRDGATSDVVFELPRSLETVVVYGDSAATASALSQQRASDRVISVVSSDAVGRLPDANIAEALQRVPGVFLERDQGEGRFVGIRGIDPNLNATRINGINVPAPEDDRRSVALDVVPSELLETLEVSKTQTPDLDGDAIGGAINVKSLSAFDRPAGSITATIENSYNRLEEASSPKVAGSISEIFELSGGAQFGVAFAGSYFDRDFGSDNIESGGWPADLETEDGVEFQGAEEIEQRNYIINRERTGAALNLDLRTPAGSEYYLRTLYSDFSDDEFRLAANHVFDDGDAISGNPTSATWEGATVERQLRDRFEEQEIWSVVAGGKNYFDRWTIDYSLGFSSAEENEPGAVETTFVAEDLTLGYDSIGSIPGLIVDPAALDTERYELDEIGITNSFTDDEETTFALNFNRDLYGSGYPGDIQFGVKLRDREKTANGDETIYDGFPGDPLLTAFSAASPDYGIGTIGPGISNTAVDAFIAANLSAFEIDEGDTLIASLAEDYVIEEDVQAAYIMSTVESGAWRAVYGVRFETTDFTARGQRLVVNDVDGDGDPVPVPVSFSRDYNDVLPSINVRYNLSENVILRGAATQSLSRPNFGQSFPGGEIEFEEDDGETELSAEIGNPLLEPVESTNLDFSYEYYPGGLNVFSVGVFYKDIDNFIVTADVADTIDLTQFVGTATVDDAEVFQPINGQSAEVLGVELAYTHGWESGFLVSANATFVDSEARLPGREGTFDLPRQSDTVANLAVGYENSAFSTRLAATYKSEALLELEELFDPDFDVYQDDHLQLDFSARWNVTPAWQVYFNAINLTDEPFYTYFARPQFNAQYEEYGRTFALGLRYAP